MLLAGATFFISSLDISKAALFPQNGFSYHVGRVFQVERYGHVHHTVAVGIDGGVAFHQSGIAVR